MGVDEFIKKYRIEVGCENPDAKECWCPKCCLLEEMWMLLKEGFIKVLEEFE